jgi:PAS domain S-box-containing protein
MWRDLLFRLRGGESLNGCDDEEAARLFHLTLCGFLIWVFLMASIGFPFFAARKLAAVCIVSVVGLFNVSALMLLRRGHRRASAKMFLTAVWVITSVLSFMTSEGRSGGFYLAWAVAVILNSGWQLGDRFAIGFAAGTLVISSVRVVALETGFPLPGYFPGAPIAIWGGEIGLTLMTVGPVLAILESRRQQVAALRESEERFRSLANSSFEGIAIQDSRGTILDANRAFAGLFGYTAPEELLGSPAQGLTREPTGKLQDGAVTELIGVRRDGTVFPIEMETRSIKYRGNEATLSAYRDLTERKEAERERTRLLAELFQSQKMESIGRLAGGVAHDFNNFLTIIIGYSQMALSDIQAEHPLHEPLSEIRKAADRSAALAKQLLAFGRKQVMLPRTVDLNAQVSAMSPMLTRLIGTEVELELALNAAAAFVHADPTQLDQVMLNLAANARDAMPNGGKLRIETNNAEKDNEYVVLAATDTGTGMDTATRQRMFEPFFTTKETGQGTGLGLAMVQGIVAQTGGYIDVRSELGEGTTVWIYLPRVSGDFPSEIQSRS